jgi:hypothetical protein
MGRTAAFLCFLGFIAAGCGGSTSATSVPDTLPSTVVPTDGVPFTLVVEPPVFSPVMAGQRCVVLVSIEGGEAPAAVSAVVTGNASVHPAGQEVGPGAVAEFTVIPGRVASEAVATSETLSPEPGLRSVRLELLAERGSHRDSAALSLELVEWSDDLEPMASELRDRFVAYLETNRPELGITAGTEWTPTITKPQILVVMHYLFFSDDWEMGIIWHVTVPEHAWSRMYLRPRDELKPTIGLEIASYLDSAAQPVPWDPPPEVDR